jgi:hypothetical protein
MILIKGDKEDVLKDKEGKMVDGEDHGRIKEAEAAVLRIEIPTGKIQIMYQMLVMQSMITTTKSRDSSIQQRNFVMLVAFETSRVALRQ